jgi:hypothetical protein
MERQYAGPGFIVTAGSPREARRLIRMAQRKARSEHRKVGDPRPWWLPQPGSK